METKLNELQKAREAVKYLLDNENGSVSFHGLEYWAGRVEALREEIKNNL